MKLPKYRAMSDEQLDRTLTETLKKNLFQLRFQSATDRLETPSEMRKAKRDIARIRRRSASANWTRSARRGTERRTTAIRPNDNRAAKRRATRR